MRRSSVAPWNADARKQGIKAFHQFVCVSVCACSSAERVCPPGASARGREDHCGGDEEQWPDCYWGEVCVILEAVGDAHLCSWMEKCTDAEFLVSCRSLVDAVYSLKDEVHELKKVSFLLCEEHFTHNILISHWHNRIMSMPECFPGEQVDEAVSGGGAEISQRAGESCTKTVQAEERLHLGRRRPLKAPVRMRHSKLAEERGGGERVHLCVRLCCISVFQPHTELDSFLLLEVTSSDEALFDIRMKSCLSSWSSLTRRHRYCASSAKPRLTAWNVLNALQQTEQFLSTASYEASGRSRSSATEAVASLPPHVTWLFCHRHRVCWGRDWHL